MKAQSYIDPKLYEMLDTCKNRFQQLLSSENSTKEELASCQVAIQYCLAEIAASHKAQQPKTSIAGFFKSMLVKITPAPKMRHAH